MCRVLHKDGHVSACLATYCISKRQGVELVGCDAALLSMPRFLRRRIALIALIALPRSACQRLCLTDRSRSVLY